MTRAWVDQALCGTTETPREFDADIGGVFKPLDVLVATAELCGHCPVYWECKEWADEEILSSPDCNVVAAGALYARGKRTSLLREVAS